MPVTLYNLFYHAKSIVQFFIVLIDQISEEIQEVKYIMIFIDFEKKYYL